VEPRADTIRKLLSLLISKLRSKVRIVRSKVRIKTRRKLTHEFAKEEEDKDIS
ncbi:4421_t:CDS:2, partial [Paraglomus occultum]